MIRLVLLFLISSISFSAKSQFMRESQTRALDSLQKLKPLFQKASNDSIFVTKHSDEKYRYYFFVRGDQAVDIEEQIYKTKVGDVAGPFRGEDTSNFLFKVISFDGYTTRNKASLVYLKPEPGAKSDTVSMQKYAKKIAEALSKGKNAREIAEKDKIRLLYEDLGYFYEEQTDKKYFEHVMKAEKGKTVFVDTEKGPAILYITTEKEKVPYKVKLIAIVKKG